MTQTALLGTGLLGSGIAEAAAKRGDSVTVWNRTLDKARALEAFGIRVANSPADAVRGAEVVRLVLKDDASVDDVIAAMRPGLLPTAIIVDHTTTLPALTLERAMRLDAEGIRYLHCPVFMGPSGARKQEGTVLAAGPRALFDAVKYDLGKMGQRLEYLGERPDIAAVFKLCGNAYTIGIAAIVADVFSIAAGGAVAPPELLKLMDIWNPNAIIASRTRNMSAGNFTPGFELTMARKDVRLMLETAVGPLAVLPGVADRMDTLIAEGHGDQDMGVLGHHSLMATTA
jgi:3-hydroxyisobutyrate dehydrogenase-like beta-hydroxyacid dehydrogenase